MNATGYEERCASCSSDHRAEIDRRLLAGDTTRAVAVWLEVTHGQRLSHKAIGRHRHHVQDLVDERMARSLEAAAPAVVAAVDPKVKAVADLDRLLRENRSLLRDARRVLDVSLSSPARDGADGEKNIPLSPTAVTLYTSLVRERRALIEARHELLTDDGGKKGKGGKNDELSEVLKQGLANLLGHGFAPDPRAGAAVPGPGPGGGGATPAAAMGEGS